MAAVVVRDGRVLVGVDPATAWSLIADLSRLSEWAPVHSVGMMAAEAPAVGHAVFVTLRRRTDPDRALHLRIAEWEAGHRYLCTVEGSRLVTEGKLEVTLTGAPHEGIPVTGVELRFRGEGTKVAAPVLRYQLRRRFRKALNRLERLLAP